MKHNGTCPQCGGEIPNNAFYCSEKCGNKYRRELRRRGMRSDPTRTGRSKRERYLSKKGK